METHPLLQALGLADGTDINIVERYFLEKIQGLVQAAEHNYDPARLKEHEAALQQLYKAFFSYALYWIKQEKEKSAQTPGHPDAATLKLSAANILKELEQNIMAYAVSYMRVNRFMVLIRDEMRKEEKSIIGRKKINWSSDIGLMLERNKAQKRKIVAEDTRLQSIASILTKGVPFLHSFEENLNIILNDSETEKAVGSLRSSLRTSQFDRARKTVKTLSATGKKFTLGKAKIEQAQKNVLESGNNFIALIEENATALTGGELKLFLHPDETLRIQKANKQELVQINKALLKYNFPYLTHKLSQLITQREKLLIIASIEGLMTLYKKLINGLAYPLPDMKAVREYESEVIDRARYLLDTQFSEIPKIHDQAQIIVTEFQDALKEAKELAALEDEKE